MFKTIRFLKLKTHVVQNTAKLFFFFIGNIIFLFGTVVTNFLIYGVTTTLVATALYTCVPAHDMPRAAERPSCRSSASPRPVAACCRYVKTSKVLEPPKDDGSGKAKEIV